MTGPCGVSNLQLDAGTTRRRDASASTGARRGLLINDRECAVGLGEGGGKAPDGEAISATVGRKRFTFAVVDLPGNGAAFIPPGAFGPGEENFTARIANGDRMFGLCFRGDGRGDFAGFGIQSNEEDAPVRFGGGEDFAQVFRKGGAAHWAGANVPLMRVSDFEVCCTIARDEKRLVTVGHFIGGAIQRKDVALRIGECSHAATTARSGGFGDGGGFALEGLSSVGRTGDEYRTSAFLVGVTGLLGVPGDIHVAL